uniref:Reverse transcriptase domain-containing protein n=1 Tax=Tanacetum cinerariifolium TaxID=118510 RepID=A0A699HP17_TANCI|nr:reverse transcriptase domain-containing protein [Tanacetum cinerariifolium]
MSSSTHPIILNNSDIKDAFSLTNIPNYVSASPNHSPASLGNTPSDASEDPFEDQELLPPKEQVSYLTSSTTDLSNPSRKQACILVPPSLSVYTPTSPQIFEIGKSSIKMHMKHHEKQIEDILNYLEELSFHRIEKIEERLVNDWMIIQRDFDELKTELEKAHSQISGLQKKHIGQKDKIAFARFRISTLEITLKDIQARHQMALKRTSTSAAPAMTQAVIRQLVADSVAAALEAQAANMENADNTNRNPEPKEALIARKCSYKEFISCQPFNFKGAEGAVGLIRWFKQSKSVFSYSNCTKDCKVKFATEAYKITWSEFKKLLIKKYCPRTEVKKMEDEFYNLTVKINDLKTYVRRFQELATLCPIMVPNSEKMMEVFIGGLSQSIEGNVTASKPQTLEEAINISQRLMDQNRRQEAVRAYAINLTKSSWYAGNLPLCRRCRLHHT